MLRAPLTLSFAYLGPLAASLLFEARLRKLANRTVLRSWAAGALAIFPFAYALVLLRVSTALLTGRSAWIAALVGFGVCCWLGVGGGLTLARVLGLARPASARVQAVVQRASERLGVRCRAVWELDFAPCNAFALPLSRKIMFSQGALALQDDELEAIAGHELGHLDETLRIKLVRPLSVVLATAAAFSVPPLPGVSATSVAVFLVLLLGFALVARRARRQGERYADSRAKDEAGVYARALARIYELGLVPLVLPRPGMHGHLYDRLVAAGQPPLEPRPAPARMPPYGLRLLLAVPMLLPLLVVVETNDLDPSTTTQATFQLAMGSHSHRAFAELGHDAAERHDYRSASTYYRAAKAERPRSVVYGALLTGSLAYDQQCAAAEAALTDTLDLAGHTERSNLPAQSISWGLSAVSWCRARAARAD
jgi:Zn-dependent protease with chaperone function